jgi:2-C-methyl-D-erythritol 4-phosphate cytidylyltransferase / 2-C-methyl-D-erythritol 2,4-cyclodiphosphate synthase
MATGAMTNNPGSKTTAALIVAAGSGVRAGSDGPAKQYRTIGGRPVLEYSLETFLSHPAVTSVQVVIGAQDAAQYEALAPQNDKLRRPVTGATTRQGSVMSGLAAYREHPPDRVLIHDGVRPFVGVDLITRVIDALDRAEAVVPTLPVTATLKKVDTGGRVNATVSRAALHTAETPQGFHYATILAAHTKAASNGLTFTDDAAVAEWAGLTVCSVPGDANNVKLTTAADIAAADRRLLADEILRLGDVRVGNGYDVHAFGPGGQVTLGGIAIPHAKRLIGHSDADVALHALTDAILGTLADGDIGKHFPPSDARWKDASSDRFLADAARRVAARGGVISHLDVSLIAETPKIAPHRDAMRRRIAEICGVNVERVAVKATTNEGLGFIGRGEGIAAYATATIRLPFGSNG